MEFVMSSLRHECEVIVCCEVTSCSSILLICFVLISSHLFSLNTFSSTIKAALLIYLVTFGLLHFLNPLIFSLLSGYSKLPKLYFNGADSAHVARADPPPT
jgi:hypothetical protein